MKTYIKNIVMLIPFILLLMNGVSLLLHNTVIWGKLYYNVISQITGYGILSIFFMYFYAHVHKFCLYSKVSIVGLGLLNLFNICYYVFSLTTYIPYASIIVATTLLLAIIFIIKKN